MKDWQNPEYENRLKRIGNLEKLLKCSSLSEFKRNSFEEELLSLKNQKTLFYEKLKEFVLDPKCMLLKLSGGIIVGYWGRISENPHYPGVISMECQCFCDFEVCQYKRLLSPLWCEKISKKQFILELMKGNGSRYDYI
ncbi:hypothetical protein KJ603_01040 [Patescibacteria group bacterium]|nr:hypothetical protein [Patescibacteria group bacterium]